MSSVGFLRELASNRCELCPRKCGADRSKEVGFCGCSNVIDVSSYNLHYGEEPPVSGRSGSGTVFFAGCNMRCVYCQNYPISQLKSAFRSLSVDELSNIMIELQNRGAHNINLVTPSHFVHLICEAVNEARSKGLSIPVVYNTSSYDRDDVIEALSECVDVYLADLKYLSSALSLRLSGVKDYPEVATRAIMRMWQTKGQPVIEEGLIKRGLMVRHLVIPGHVDNSIEVVRWLHEHVPDAYVSLMSQYFPAHRAFEYPDINRRLTLEEWESIRELFYETRLNGYIQEFSHS